MIYCYLLVNLMSVFASRFISLFSYGGRTECEHTCAAHVSEICPRSLVPSAGSLIPICYSVPSVCIAVTSQPVLYHIDTFSVLLTQVSPSLPVISAYLRHHLAMVRLLITFPLLNPGVYHPILHPLFFCIRIHVIFRLRQHCGNCLPHCR